MRRFIPGAVGAALCALGLVAALALTRPPAANAYDIANLPAPYTVDSLYDSSAPQGACQTFYVVHWYDQSVKLGYGPEVGQQFSDCNPQFQTQLDAFVNATINLTPPATTTPATTTAPTTTAAPPDTTSPTTTTTAPAPTTTVTETVTTVIVDPTINQRLTDLEAKYAALAARVDAIAQANTASWDAFKAAIDSGSSVSDAALAARSAGLNAIYQL